MRRTVFVLSIFAVLVFSVAQLAEAQWKANLVVNQTDESLYVIHSTWRPAKEDIPNGFRTRGRYRLLPGETRQFYAWSDNSIYFRIWRSGEAIKPDVDKVTFRFWVHPSRSFMIVSDELSAGVKFSDLSYVDRSREGFVREDGFMKYSNGSVVNITSGWVSVVPDAPDAGGVVDLPDTGDGVGPGVTPATPAPVPSVTSPPEPTAAPEGMVLIPAGAFRIGSNDVEGHADGDERPIHTVYLDAFYMDTHEVTNTEYAAFLNAKGKHAEAGQIWLDIGHADARIEFVAGVYRPMSGYANRPVVEVSWYGAMAYAAWAGKRLPTEAEWEYAARGGLSGRKYPWGDAIDSGRANYDRNIGSTTAVGKYTANGYGLYDMAGNVYEWCLDEYNGNFYTISPVRNPLSGAPHIKWLLDNYTWLKSYRVLRGGSWYSSHQYVRVADRGGASPTATLDSFGFRCARSVSPTTVSSVTLLPQGPPAAPEGMVLIPAGEFQMGSNDWESSTDEQPIHTVYVDAFYMDMHEVTNLDFKLFVLANPQWQKSRIPHNLHNGDYLDHWDSSNNYPAGKANHPVVYVSWYAAVAYAKWAGKRLPTEAEWEKAARGGKSGLKYPWGDTINFWYANYGCDGTTAVGAYPANGYGLHGMAGNAQEWCLDAYNKDYYFSSPARNPLSDVNTLSNVDLILDNYTQVNSSRVLRGGSWCDTAWGVRVAARLYDTPSHTDYFTGFRCARSVSP